ncbi:hypothetical protein [Roseomonas sp. BN140053]|uniref:hypothetical protein n=1 Tax=Roseomonas sp. BN140053 TaxID=3391898 RepID=UPI0039EC7C3F
MRIVLVALALVPFAMSAAAQQLDPRIAGPLMQMINAAGMQCQAGNPQGCGTMRQLQQAGAELTQAQEACQQGNPQACQVLQAGAQQVMGVYQQFQMAGAGGGAPPMVGGPAVGSGYSSQQMQADHQARMQQQQQQFQQQQAGAARQQQMNDAQHQRFMEQLRR